MPGSDCNEGVFGIPQSSSITGTSPSDCLVSYPGQSLGSLTSPQRSNQCIHLTQHRIFNLHQHPKQRSPYISITFAVEGTTLSDIAITDSGCSIYTVLISRLSEEVRKHIIHSDIRVKGIKGSITVWNEIKCNLTIGNHNSPVFKWINVLITSAITSILISQNIPSRSPVDSYMINNQDITVEFKCTLAFGSATYTVDIATST